MEILIDLDDTVVSLMPMWIRAYNDTYNDDEVWLNYAAISSWDVWQYATSCTKEQFYSILARPGFFDYLPAEVDAVAAITSLVEMGHSVYFATATPNAEAARGKVEWVTREFSHLKFGIDRIIQIHDKTRLSGDLLIDDKFDNVRAWKATGRAVICYGQKWNKDALDIADFYAHQTHTDPTKWDQIVQFIKKEYNGI